jgi:hypothetical protein
MIHRNILSPRTFLIVLFLLSGAAGYTLPGLAALFTANRGVQVDVDANIESGHVVEVYVNYNWNTPLTVPIVPGVRSTYTISKIFENVGALRIDLGKISGAKVEVYGITVSVDGKVAIHYGPDVIYKWVQAQPDTINGNPEQFADHVTFVEKGYGPSLIISDVFAGAVPKFLRLLLPLDRDGIVLTFSAAFLVLIALARSPILVRGLTLLIFVGVAAASMVAVRLANATLNWPDPVNEAVGRAGYSGLSLLPNRTAAAATLAVAIFLSAAAIFITRHIRRRNANAVAADASIEPPHPQYDRNRLLRGMVVVLVVVIIASMYFAEVYPRITYNLRLPFTNNWDSNNANFWRYLVFEGFRPLRDFWFPYGGTWIFALPAPWGQLSEASMHAAVYSVLFLALVRLCGIIPAIIILFTVLVCEGTLLMWAAWRYLLATNVVLSYVAIGNERSRFHWGHLLFCIALSLTLFFAPEQTFYAAPAVLVLLLLDLVQRKTPVGGALVRRLAIEFILSFAFLVIYFTLISDFGELRAIVSFLLSLGAAAYSSAVPTSLADAMHWPFQVGLLLMAGPAALVGAGLYRRLSRTSSTPALDDVLMGLGLVGFMLFQKHLMRPVEWQFTTPTLLAMLIWLVADPAFRRARTAIVGGVAAGVLFWSIDIGGAAGDTFRRALDAPVGAFNSIANLIRSAQVVAQARDDAYSAKRFSGFPSLIDIERQLRTLGGGEIPKPVYVIGDASMLYALLHQPPPYNTNDYNASPIFEQRRVVDWIVQQKPRFAVWNTNDLVFDDFQRVVRDPLLYATDAATFVPVSNVGEFAILRRRADGEPPALAWWRERLGGKIDFGGLLRRSSFDRLADCSDAPSLDRCAPFLEIAVPPELRSQPRLAVSVMAGDLPFRIEFAPSSAIATYHVRLDRLWFWDAARLAHLPFRIVGAENPAVAVKLATKAPDDQILY